MLTSLHLHMKSNEVCIKKANSSLVRSSSTIVLFYFEVADSESFVCSFKCWLVWLCRDLLSGLLSHLSHVQNQYVNEP